MQTMKKNYFISIAFVLFTASSVIAQTTAEEAQKDTSQEMLVQKEMMRIIYDMKHDTVGIENTVTPLKSLPWEESSAKLIPEYKELSDWLHEIKLKRDSSNDDNRMRLTAYCRSSIGPEGMQSNRVYLQPTFDQKKAGSTLSLLSQPLPSIGGLRVKLTSRLRDATGKPIGFNTRHTFIFLDKDSRSNDGYYHRSLEFSFSLDTVYSAVAGGYVEMQVVAPQRYQYILLSPADVAVAKNKVFDSTPFRVRLFEGDQLLISAASQYSDSINDTWKYICMRNGQPVKASSTGSTNGRCADMLTLSQNPTMTFDEWWETVNAEHPTHTNKEWGKLYQTGVSDMEQVYLYKLVPDDKSMELASVKAYWDSKSSTDAYLNDTLWKELTGDTLFE